MPLASFRRALLLVAVAGLVPGCGDAAAPVPPRAASPQRIVCGNTAAAEFVRLLVPAGRVAGVPQQVDDFGAFDFASEGFERVPRMDRYTAESVLALKPDLVVTHEWQSADTTSLLRSQGIDVLVVKSATSYADVHRSLVDLGERLGAAERSAGIVRDLDARVARLKDTSAARAARTVLYYSNNGMGGTTAGAHTTPDATIHLAGLRNAAAEAGFDGHVALDFERLLAIDPDFLVVSTRARGEGGSATQSVVESTPVLADLRARRLGRIVVLPAALMSTDSPALVDAAEVLARAVDRALSGAKRD